MDTDENVSFFIFFIVSRIIVELKGVFGFSSYFRHSVLRCLWLLNECIIWLVDA
jgi:hypothetical protein